MYGLGSGLRHLPRDLGLTRTFLWDRSLRGHRLHLVTGRNRAWLTPMSCAPTVCQASGWARLGEPRGTSLAPAWRAGVTHMGRG